jgi:hypothetical protein
MDGEQEFDILVATVDDHGLMKCTQEGVLWADGRIDALQQQVENELAAREEAEQDADRLQQQVESLDGALAVAVRWANKRADRHQVEGLEAQLKALRGVWDMSDCKHEWGYGGSCIHCDISIVDAYEALQQWAESLREPSEAMLQEKGNE